MGDRGRADYVVVEIDGDATGARGEIYRDLAPKFMPFAFTNPIFVDADGDRAWTAPGLPDRLPPELTDPLSTAPQPER